METCGHMEFFPRGHDRELKKKKWVVYRCHGWLAST